METIRLNYKKRNSLKYLELPNLVNNTECNLYPINLGKNWRKSPKLLKEFRNLGNIYMSNKLALLNNLIEFKDCFNSVPELVLPEKIAFIEKKDEACGGINEHLGYIMPYIKNNVNMALVFKHENIKTEKKIEYLKEIGNIIARVQQVKPLGENFYLCDIHEGNFIYDFDSESIKVVDLDSSKIFATYPFPSKYLSTNKVIKNKEFDSKYQKNYKGDYLPNENSEWLCFITMILNTISNGKITSLSYKEYYDYLAFLSDNGFPYELLEKFSAIYQKYDNSNPTPYLDLVPSNVENVSLENFKSKVRQK